MSRYLIGKPRALFVVAMSLLVIGCEGMGTGNSSTSSMVSAPSSTSVEAPAVSTTASPPESTSIPLDDSPTEVWHYSSSAIGREIGHGDDFAVSGDVVAVLVGDDAQGAAVLDLQTGEELWQIAFSESPGRILGFLDGRLAWATYERVGVHSPDGQALWEYEFVDTRWPSRAVVQDGRTAFALDPTIEGDNGPPLVAQFDRAGDLLWSSQLTESREDEDLQWVEPLIADDGLIVQTTDALYRLDWSTGNQDWRVPFAEADIETFDMTGLFEANGTVYAADPGGEFSGREGGEILGVNASTGENQVLLQVGRTPRLIGFVENRLIYTDEAGVHGVSTETDDSWNADMPDVVAVIDRGRVVAVSPSTLTIMDPDGKRVSEVSTSVTDPQLRPVSFGEVLLVPGWQGTEAIDLASGQSLMSWPGESYANAVELDARRLLLGVAGDGIYMLEVP